MSLSLQVPGSHGSPCGGRIFMPARRRGAFTLVELLVVVGMIVVISALALPALTALQGSTNLTTASYNVSGMIQLARSYAIANNTYVYLGFEECDASKLASTTPQASGVGRVAMYAVASNDGTKGFTSPGFQGGLVLTSGNFRPVASPMRMEGIHLPNGLGAVPTAGNMGTQAGRRDVTARQPAYELMYTTSPAVTFSYPLSATPGSNPSAQYQFSNVIQFDPQGAARVLVVQGGQVDTDSVPFCIELCLQQSHGNAVPPMPANANLGNQVSIQVDGMTGNVRCSAHETSP